MNRRSFLSFLPFFGLGAAQPQAADVKSKQAPLRTDRLPVKMYSLSVSEGGKQEIKKADATYIVITLREVEADKGA